MGRQNLTPEIEMIFPFIPHEVKWKRVSPVLKVARLVEGPHARLFGHVRVGEAQAAHGQEATVLRQRYLGQNLITVPSA